ncbi:hypothetical protein D3C77_570870 [compost metagenome]
MARRAHTPAVWIPAHQPAGQLFGRRAGVQLEQARYACQLRFEAQLPCLIDQTWRIPRATQQQREQIVTTLSPPLLLHLQVALGQEHFRGHAHQLRVGAQLLRVARKTQHPHQAPIE